MEDDPNYMHISIPLLTVLLTLYYFFKFKYLAKNKETYAIYSRSFLLLNVSNSLNYFEVISSIIAGTIINNHNFFDPSIIFLLL